MRTALHRWLSKAPSWVPTLLGIVLVGVIGAADYATGAELSSSVFYALPVGLAAWYGSARAGVFLCLLASTTWYAADQGGGHVYSASWIPAWNTGVRLLFFLIISDLLARLRRSLEAQRRLAEQDGLTGLANARRFMASVEAEVSRSRRYGRPLSLVYMDLDGFKAVNDSQGHMAGDAVLEIVGTTLGASVRANDLAARLGGDEFAVLLPETDGSQARTTADKIRTVLEAAMATRSWPVGFSMGVHTSLGEVEHADDLVRSADGLMYEAKQSGKGCTRFSVGSPRGVRAL